MDQLRYKWNACGIKPAQRNMMDSITVKDVLLFYITHEPLDRDRVLARKFYHLWNSRQEQLQAQSANATI